MHVNIQYASLFNSSLRSSHTLTSSSAPLFFEFFVFFALAAAIPALSTSTLVARHFRSIATSFATLEQLMIEWKVP